MSQIQAGQGAVKRDEDGQPTHALVYMGLDSRGYHLGLEWSLYDQRWRVFSRSRRFWMRMIAGDDYIYPCNVDKLIRGVNDIPHPVNYHESKEYEFLPNSVIAIGEEEVEE